MPKNPIIIDNRPLGVVTLRDLFAGMAMQGMVMLGEETSLSAMASDAYRHADAMLVERERQKP